MTRGMQRAPFDKIDAILRGSQVCALFCVALCTLGRPALAREPDVRLDTGRSATPICGETKIAHGAVKTQETTLHGVPAILRFPSVVTQPPVILWHGFGTPATPAELMHALPLDNVPAIKVYLWLPLFGPREPPGGTDEVARRQAQDYVMLVFEPSVIGAAGELPEIVSSLTAHRCMRDGDGVGLFGFSAGGAAVLSVLAERRVRVGAAVIVNAPVNLDATIAALERATKHPYQWTLQSQQIAERADALKRVAAIAAGDPLPRLLIIHGADDSVIASKGAIALEHALRPYYHDRHFDAGLQMTIEPGVSHSWTEPSVLNLLQVHVADWFSGVSKYSALEPR
jgi:predicted esterase